jgi:hypothetical protein
MMSVALRRWHSYIGLLIAPSVLFFALTGALQIFNLHEAHTGYRPAPLIEKLSAVHKDQVFEQPAKHHDDNAPPSPGTPAGDEPAQRQEEDKTSGATFALKWYFLFVALALSASTLIGIWMGITQIGRTAIAWALLAAGALLPIGLLLLA